MLTVIDEFTRRCLAIVVARRLRSDDVLQCLTDLFVAHGPPEHIRSDNGPEFVALNVRNWLGRIGVKSLYIEPGSPWENGYCESFNSKLRVELLDGEIFYNLAEARVVIEAWRRHYNTKRPHSSLGYCPPVPEVVQGPAPPTAGHPGGGAETRHAIRMKPDHPIGAGHTFALLNASARQVELALPLDDQHLPLAQDHA
jgi:hypothetical protein